MGSHCPDTLENMKLFKILFLVSSIAGAPQSSFPRIDVARFVDKVQKENYPTDNRVKVAISSKSPSSVAALAYVNYVVKQLKHTSGQFLMEETKKQLLEKQPELTSLLLILVKDTKKVALVRRLIERGKLLGLMEGKIMFLKLLLLLSTSGQELRMVILALLLGLTMLRRYSLVTHTMMLLLLQ